MSQLAQIRNDNVKRSTIKTRSPQYHKHEESTAILNGTDSNVLCMIRRKRASNLVVYTANIIKEIDANGNEKVSVNSKQPIDIFWLKLSKQDMQKHRESGKMDDRVNITKIERKLVYGVTCKKIITSNNTNNTKQKKSFWKSIKSKGNPKNTTNNTTMDGEVNEIENNNSYKVVFNALKSIQMTLRICEEDNTPNLYGKMKDNGVVVDVILKEIWVTMRKSKNLKIPKIDYITIKAIKIRDKKQIEYIMKKGE
eukprot:729376_1